MTESDEEIEKYVTAELNRCGGGKQKGTDKKNKYDCVKHCENTVESK